MSKKSITGIIDITRRGTGFIAHPEGGDDILVAADHTLTALNGDTVEVEILRKNRGRFEGRVTKVLERARKEFVGTLECVQGKQSRQCTLRADNPRIPIAFVVENVPQDAVSGTKALVELSEWSNPLLPPKARFIRSLGQAGSYHTEMEAIVLAQDFELTHSPDAEAEARGIAASRTISDDEIAKRRDFRGIPTFTIDPEDAKDFDDALSVRTLENGLFEVGVHIADVTHYVRPGTALEREARTRATSIYLTGLTVPMLPEELSNDVCSLKPDEDRLTFSAVFTMDKNAGIKDRWFGKTIIRSVKRFTYQGAQDVLAGSAATPEYASELNILQDLARIMRKERSQSGAISFETSEVRFQLDAEGKPVKAIIKERLETMKMIEDWMLLANREVATWLSEHVKSKSDLDKTFVFRVHDTPDSDRIEELRVFLKALGYELGRAGQKVKPAEINALFKSLEGKPEAALVQMATLRSMAKATYTHTNIGHFSLGFQHYTHFTSPIRRYPDMIVHRILAGHVDGSPVRTEELAEYRRLAISSSEREVAAVEAERASIRYMHVLNMQRHIGETFEGIITGVADHGMYVEERTTKAEGLVPMRSLEDDYYIVDRTHYRIMGSRTGRVYRMGDTVKVRLVSADTTVRQIEWKLVTE